VRYADLRGYSYDRSDVTARGLANAYAQTLGSVFTQESKPYEVEIVVAEVGRDAASDQIYRLTYDGSVADEHGLVAMGGASDQIEERLTEKWRPGLSLAQALRLAAEGLAHDPAGGPDRELGPESLEVAVLDRTRPRRTFRRINADLLGQLLSHDDPTDDVPPAEHDSPRQAASNPQTQRHDDEPTSDSD
jgi:proteasome alpha subunit